MHILLFSQIINRIPQILRTLLPLIVQSGSARGAEGALTKSGAPDRIRWIRSGAKGAWAPTGFKVDYIIFYIIG